MRACATQAIAIVLSFADLLWVTRANVEYGFSDKVFVLGQELIGECWGLGGLGCWERSKGLPTREGASRRPASRGAACAAAGDIPEPSLGTPRVY